MTLQNYIDAIVLQFNSEEDPVEEIVFQMNGLVRVVTHDHIITTDTQLSDHYTRTRYAN